MESPCQIFNWTHTVQFKRIGDIVNTFDSVEGLEEMDRIPNGEDTVGVLMLEHKEDNLDRNCRAHFLDSFWFTA